MGSLHVDEHSTSLSDLAVSWKLLFHKNNLIKNNNKTR